MTRYTDDVESQSSSFYHRFYDINGGTHGSNGYPNPGIYVR